MAQGKNRMLYHLPVNPIFPNGPETLKQTCQHPVEEIKYCSYYNKGNRQFIVSFKCHYTGNTAGK